MVKEFYKKSNPIFAVKFDGSQNSKNEIQEMVNKGNEISEKEEMGCTFSVVFKEHEREGLIATLTQKSGDEFATSTTNSYCRVNEWAVIDFTSEYNIYFQQCEEKYFQKEFIEIK